MRVVKVSEVSGVALDWLVATCEGYIASITESDEVVILREGVTDYFDPHRNWGWAGPIIEREDIFFSPLPDKGLRAFQFKDGQYLNILDCWPYKEQPTRLLLGMRCYVISKLGETAEVPEDLPY